MCVKLTWTYSFSFSISSRCSWMASNAFVWSSSYILTIRKKFDRLIFRGDRGSHSINGAKIFESSSFRLIFCWVSFLEYRGILDLNGFDGFFTSSVVKKSIFLQCLRFWFLKELIVKWNDMFENLQRCRGINSSSCSIWSFDKSRIKFRTLHQVIDILLVC